MQAYTFVEDMCSDHVLFVRLVTLHRRLCRIFRGLCKNKFLEKKVHKEEEFLRYYSNYEIFNVPRNYCLFLDLFFTTGSVICS